MESDQLKDKATQLFSPVTTSESSFFLFFLLPRFIKHLTLLGFPACLQVVGDQEDDDNQGGRRRQETTESWQPAATGARKQHRPHPHPSEEQAGWFRQQASGQHYADHALANVEPTDEELNDLSVACNRLWELDLNRLTPGQDYKIDCGEGKKLYNREDMSGDSLFKYLDQSVFQRPTYARFYNLLDNYHADESSREQLTSAEQQEQVAFIEEISRTAPIKYLLKYLAAKRILPGSMEQFKETLQTLWFKFYGRGGTRDASSAFEHVFVGEIKRSSEVSGFHNWIQVWP
jgi:poly(U)-specific endoribonuclease